MLISKIAAALMAFALALLAPATLAAAQTDDYVGGNPDEIDTGVPGGVGSGGDEAPAGGEATTGGAGQAEAPGAAAAPSGSLPVTGGDVLGLTLLGLGAVATGAVLVRRSGRAETAR